MYQCIFAGSNRFFKHKRLSIPPEMPYMEVKDRVTELFPCLWSTVFAFSKLAPNGLFATMSPEPRTARHIKNWIFPAAASTPARAHKKYHFNSFLYRKFHTKVPGHQFVLLSSNDPQRRTISPTMSSDRYNKNIFPVF